MRRDIFFLERHFALKEIVPLCTRPANCVAPGNDRALIGEIGVGHIRLSWLCSQFPAPQYEVGSNTPEHSLGGICFKGAVPLCTSLAK